MRALFHRGRPDRTAFLAFAAILLAFQPSGAAAQEKRPDVHSDFEYGVFPYDPAALERFESEEARYMISAFHKGWNLDKYLKESGIREVDGLTLLQGFEDDNLVRGDNDYDLRPGFPVIREDELRETAGPIAETAAALAAVIEGHWSEFGDLASSLEAAREFPREEVLYRVVAGGLLFGGMIDALFDDKTLMPSPPRRSGRREAYYSWMTEGEQGPRQLVRQSAQVGRHQVFSIGGSPVDDPRVEIRELARTAPVFEYDDARRWRVFMSVTARDYLLPDFKSHRSEMLELASTLDSSKYTAFAEFVAWFYLSAATEAVDLLETRGLIKAPETSYRYALVLD